MIQRLSDERGIALVTALLVSMVVLSLGLTVVALSHHNANQSAYDRRRVQAVHAAEAGLNEYFSRMRTSTGATTCQAINGNLPAAAASYSVTIRLYSAWPVSAASELTCPPPAGSTVAGALVSSRGVAGGTVPNTTATRTMQSLVRMGGVFAPYGQAIFSDSSIDLVNRLTVNGDGGTNADVYTNGNYVQSNSTRIQGSVYAQGRASIDSGTVDGDVWANDFVSVKGTVFGNAISSTSYITVDGGRVAGYARAGTTITVSGSGRIDGARIPNSPSGAPPHRSFPRVTFDAASWTSAGYTIETFTDCTSAKNAILTGGVPGASRVVRIAAVCELSFNGDTVAVPGNLAIVTDGSFTTQNRTTFQAGLNAPYRLHIIVPYRDGLPCTPGANYDINVSNLTRFNALELFVYSPCTVNFGNNNSEGVTGQIMGGRVSITNNMTLNFKPLLVPGANITGYNVEIAYLREVRNS